MPETFWNGRKVWYPAVEPHALIATSMSAANTVKGVPTPSAESSNIRNFMLFPPTLAGSHVKYFAGTPPLEGMVSVAVTP
jgi:hypothetical protein